MSIAQRIKESVDTASPKPANPAIIISKYDFDRLAMELGIFGDDITKEDVDKMCTAVGAKIARFQMPASGWFVCEFDVMVGFVEMVQAASLYQQMADRAQMMEIQRRQKSGIIMPQA